MPFLKNDVVSFQAHDLSEAVANSDAQAMKLMLNYAGYSLADRLERTGIDLNGIRPIVFGLGGDFEEFCAPFVMALKLKRTRIGCLWPVETEPYLRPRARVPVAFEQEYFERSGQATDLVIVAQSIIADRSPSSTIVRRIRELTTSRTKILIVAAAATKSAIDALANEDVVVLAGLQLHPLMARSIDYWKVAELLDIREHRFVPRMSRWLVGRMEARDKLALGHDGPRSTPSSPGHNIRDNSEIMDDTVDSNPFKI